MMSRYVLQVLRLLKQMLIHLHGCREQMRQSSVLMAKADVSWMGHCLAETD